MQEQNARAHIGGWLYLFGVNTTGSQAEPCQYKSIAHWPFQTAYVYEKDSVREPGLVSLWLCVIPGRLGSRLERAGFNCVGRTELQTTSGYMQSLTHPGSEALLIRD